VKDFQSIKNIGLGFVASPAREIQSILLSSFSVYVSSAETSASFSGRFTALFWKGQGVQMISSQRRIGHI
jgi:hypothetical protein